MLEENEETVYTERDLLDRLEVDIHVRTGGNPIGIKLLLGIIRSAAETGDEAYFHGPTFEWYCSMLGLDHDFLMQYIKKHKFKTGKYKNPLITKRKEIIKRFLEGDSKAKIAKLYAKPVYYVDQVLLGRKRIKKVYPKIDIIHDRACGLTYRQLIKKYKISSQMLKNIIDKGIDNQ